MIVYNICKISSASVNGKSLNIYWFIALYIFNHSWCIFNLFLFSSYTQHFFKLTFAINWIYWIFNQFFFVFLVFRILIGQMFLMNKFFDGEFMTFGLDVIKHMESDQEDRMDPMIYIFPRMTKCTFYKYGVSGEVERHVSKRNILIFNLTLIFFDIGVRLSWASFHVLVFFLALPFEEILNKNLFEIYANWLINSIIHLSSIFLFKDAICKLDNKRRLLLDRERREMRAHLNEKSSTSHSAKLNTSWMYIIFVVVKFFAGILPLNVVNEKIYIFLWFWFIILTILTSLTVMYRIIIIFSPRMRVYLLRLRFRWVFFSLFLSLFFPAFGD